MSSDQPPAVTARHNSPDLSRRRMAEDAARVPERLPIRYAPMALSPFSFFRGVRRGHGRRSHRHPRLRAGGGTHTCPTSGPSPRRSDDSCSTSTTSTRRCPPVGVGREAAGGEHRGRGSRVAGRGSRARVRGAEAGRRRGGSRLAPNRRKRLARGLARARTRDDLGHPRRVRLERRARRSMSSTAANVLVIRRIR
jgi:hypothetical protein